MSFGLGVRRERERERGFYFKAWWKLYVGWSRRLWPWDFKSGICGSNKVEANRIFRANNEIWGNVIFPLAFHGNGSVRFGPESLAHTFSTSPTFHIQRIKKKKPGSVVFYMLFSDSNIQCLYKLLFFPLILRESNCTIFVFWDFNHEN